VQVDHQQGFIHAGQGKAGQAGRLGGTQQRLGMAEAGLFDEVRRGQGHNPGGAMQNPKARRKTAVPAILKVMQVIALHVQFLQQGKIQFAAKAGQVNIELGTRLFFDISAEYSDGFGIQPLFIGNRH